MIILLPPSSGKTAPTSGPSLDLSSLLFGSELISCREELIKDLHQVCSHANAAQVLKIGPNTVGDITDNLDVYEAPTTTALNLYTGVLFEAAKFNQTLENATLENTQKTVTLPADILNSEIMIFSGLWGVVRPHDLLPNYRLSASIKLPTAGTVATYWKKQLNPLLNASLKDQIVVDCRSGEYRKMWTPRQSILVSCCKLLFSEKILVREGAVLYRITQNICVVYLQALSLSNAQTENSLMKLACLKL